MGTDDSLAIMKQSQAILKGIVESPKDVVIFALDPGYRYLVFNEAHFQTMQRIWGVDIAIGQCMLDYIKNSDDRLKAKENFDRALSGESFIIEEEYGDTALERRYFEDIYNPIYDENGGITGLTLILRDITERKKIESERAQLIVELQEALAKVKMLSGLLPICANCKKIRNDDNDWVQIEEYIRRNSEANFSHGICPMCAEKLYPGFTTCD